MFRVFGEPAFPWSLPLLALYAAACSSNSDPTGKSGSGHASESDAGDTPAVDNGPVLGGGGASTVDTPSSQRDASAPGVGTTGTGGAPSDLPDRPSPESSTATPHEASPTDDPPSPAASSTAPAPDGSTAPNTLGECSSNVQINTGVLSGSITVGGAQASADYGRLTLTRGADVIELAGTSAHEFSRRLVVGTYDVLHTRNGETSVVESGLEITAAGTHVDIDLPNPTILVPEPSNASTLGVTFSGDVTVNGEEPPPVSGTGLNIFLRREGGDWRSIETLNGTSFYGTVTAGTYDVAMYGAAKELQGWLPENGDITVVLTDLVVPQEGLTGFVLDIPAATVSGKVTLNGADAGSFGTFTLQSETLGPVVLQPNASGNYSHLVVPGEYELLYRGKPTGPGPRNGQRLQAGVQVSSTGLAGFDIDVDAVALSGTLTVDGSPPASERDLLRFEPVTQDGTVLENGAASVMPGADGRFELEVTPGKYDVFLNLSGVSLDSALPQNVRAPLAKGIEVVSGEPSTLNLDIPTGGVNVALTLDGTPIRSLNGWGELGLRSPEHGSVALQLTEDGQYVAHAIKGTYDVIYSSTGAFDGLPENGDVVIGCVTVE